MRDSGSFRDPSGYIFVEKNKIYRIVKDSYKLNFEKLQNSGLLDELFKKKLLVKHEIIKSPKSYDQKQFLILEVGDPIRL